MSSRSISINMPINFIEGINNSKIENKKNQIINLKKELAAAIENFGSRPNAYMCFTGKAFEYFLRYYKEEKILLKEK